MKFDRRRAVSPIIASLLLIAIAVAAGIIVYVYVNSLAGGLTGSGGGNQVAQQLQLQAYGFNSLSDGSKTDLSGQVVAGFIKNVGGSSVTISAIYFDGTPLTEWYTAGSPVAYLQWLAVPTANGNCFAAIPANVGGTPLAILAATGTQTTSGTIAGSCTSTGSNACGAAGSSLCVDLGAAAGRHAETLTLATQSSVQIVIGLNTAVTAGTSHSVKIVTATGGQAVFTVIAGRSG